MRIAVITEPNNRQYVADVFEKHPDSGMELATVFTQKPQEDIDNAILDGLKSTVYDRVLLAIRNNHSLSRLLTALHDAGVSSVFAIRLFALDTKMDFIDGGEFAADGVDKIPAANEKPYLVHLETHVCDHCNLNCKACNNFSPFIKTPHVTDTARFEEDLGRLSELFSNIGRFFLLGGEPLLAPETCCEMVRMTRRYFPGTELRVLTNATLVTKMGQEFWACLRENNVIIHMALDMSGQMMSGQRRCRRLKGRCCLRWKWTRISTSIRSCRRETSCNGFGRRFLRSSMKD